MFRIDESARTECFRRGEELLNKEQYQQAANCYRKSLTQDITNFKTYKKLGYYLIKMKQF